jgi:transposase InsO family protein
LKEKYSFLQAWSVEFEAEKPCQALEVSRSGHYRYLKGETYALSQIKKQRNEALKTALFKHKRRYGSRRLKAEIEAEGIKIGRHQVRQASKKEGLQAIQPKSFIPKTTQSGHGKRNSPNLLLEKPLPQGPNQVWVSDITYLSLSNGSFAYLATYMDLSSRYIVGWQVGENMEEGLVKEALRKGLQVRKPPVGLVLHSDRGGQYVSKKLRALIKQWKGEQSMSRADEVYDNAFAESFFSRFKTEVLENRAFLLVEDARTECFEYIEIYYNRLRRHSALGYKSPYEFEEIYKQNQLILQVKL